MLLFIRKYLYNYSICPRGEENLSRSRIYI